MSIILGRRHRLLHVREFCKTERRRTRNLFSTLSISSRFPITTSRRATPRAPIREEGKGSRVLHREFAQEEMQEETFLGYSRPIHPRRDVPQEHDWHRSQRRKMSWDGQIGERSPHEPYHWRGHSSLSKQLVDPFEHGEFRHDARKASSWFQTSLDYLATAQEPGQYNLLPKVAKLFLILVELARILVAFFFRASPRRWTQHWLIGETWWSVIGPIIRSMILRINLVQN